MSHSLEVMAMSLAATSCRMTLTTSAYPIPTKSTREMLEDLMPGEVFEVVPLISELMNGIQQTRAAMKGYYLMRSIASSVLNVSKAIRKYLALKTIATQTGQIRRMAAQKALMPCANTHKQKRLACWIGQIKHTLTKNKTLTTGVSCNGEQDD